MNKLEIFVITKIVILLYRKLKILAVASAYV